MIVPPDVKHAMDVAKTQSSVSVAAVATSRGQFGLFFILSVDSLHVEVFMLRLLPRLQVSYKKDAKASLHYTTVADRPDIRKATQAAKLISDVGRALVHETQFE